MVTLCLTSGSDCSNDSPIVCMEHWGNGSVCTGYLYAHATPSVPATVPTNKWCFIVLPVSMVRGKHSVGKYGRLCELFVRTENRLV